MKKSNKGISPVVATMGLLLITIALFIILFIWSKNFVKEQIMKFGEPIENLCSQVNWEINLDIRNDGSTRLFINNIGNVNIWKIMIIKYSDGTTDTAFYSATGQDDRALTAGSFSNFTITNIDLSNANKIEIYPVLLGEGKESGKAFEFICDNAQPKVFYF